MNSVSMDDVYVETLYVGEGNTYSRLGGRYLKHGVPLGIKMSSRLGLSRSYLSLVII